MALVVNTQTHPVPLSSGRTLAYGADPVNVDVTLPLEAALITAGVLRITDPNVTPPAPNQKTAPIIRLIVSSDPMPTVLGDGDLYVQTNQAGQAVALGANLS